jgi:GTP-binding protein EngB required for normal cell division
MNDLRRLIEDLLRLVQDTEDFHQNVQIRETLQQARQILLNLHRRLSKPRYVLAMVGLSGVGKSTLLNALIGHNLAPRRNGPCTSAPIEFHHSETLRVVAYHHHRIQRPTWECATPDQVHRVLLELADGHDVIGSQEISRVEVSGSIPLLSHGLIIADTPGFGAAQMGEAVGTHENALKEYLAKEVSQVFWIIRAEQGITAREMKFHDEWISGICDDILVTGCEDWNEQDRKRFSRRFSEVFKNRLAPTFHFVSGLKGLAARTANDATGLEQAGITTLENRVKTPAARFVAMEAVLRRLAEDLGFWMHDSRDAFGQPLPTVWNPTTLAWWLAQQSESLLKKDLVRSLVPRPLSHV